MTIFRAKPSRLAEAEARNISAAPPPNSASVVAGAMRPGNLSLGVSGSIARSSSIRNETPVAYSASVSSASAAANAPSEAATMAAGPRRFAREDEKSHAEGEEADGGVGFHGRELRPRFAGKVEQPIRQRDCACEDNKEGKELPEAEAWASGRASVCSRDIRHGLFHMLAA